MRAWIGWFLLGLVWAVGGVERGFAGVVFGQGGGADLSASIEAQDRRLGSGTGVIRLAEPGRIGRAVSVGAGHDLEIGAAVRWDAQVRLLGRNRVRCGGGAVIEAGTRQFVFPKPEGAMLLAAGVAQVSVDGCRVHGVTGSVLLAALPATAVSMSGNTLDGVTLVAVGEGDSKQVTLLNNSVRMPTPRTSENAAALLFYVEGVEATGNRFEGVAHGAEWWGGDSGAAGANLSQVNRAGHMRFTGTVCRAIGGSCLWGSMGHDIEVVGNTADGCGDVCFDTEGGLRTKFTNNTARGCGNGCGAIFFFTDQTEFVGNHFFGPVKGGGLLFLKNASRDPARHDHLRVEGNELNCGAAVCSAMYQEAAGGIRFVNNTITNGMWLRAGYARSVWIARNQWTFSVPIPVALAPPDVIGGTALVVEGNRVESRVRQPAGGICVSGLWTDFNSGDRHLIDGNTCVGVAGGTAWPIGLKVVDAGRNMGLAGLWIVGANDWSGGRVEHGAEPGSREDWMDLQDAGARAAAKALPGCEARMFKLKAGNWPVCLGAADGWAIAAVP